MSIHPPALRSQRPAAHSLVIYGPRSLTSHSLHHFSIRSTLHRSRDYSFCSADENGIPSYMGAKGNGLYVSGARFISLAAARLTFLTLQRSPGHRRRLDGFLSLRVCPRPLRILLAHNSDLPSPFPVTTRASCPVSSRLLSSSALFRHATRPYRDPIRVRLPFLQQATMADIAIACSLGPSGLLRRYLRSRLPRWRYLRPDVR